MTVEETIRRLKDHFRVHDDGRPTPYLDKAVSMAITALEEVQQYRAIGTVSEFRELKERQRQKVRHIKGNMRNALLAEVFASENIV